MSSANSYVDLLIIGAGPAGLAAACWAAQYDISIRIIDQKAGRTKTGHADGIQSRTLEILDSFGIVDPILKQGTPEVDMCYWVRIIELRFFEAQLTNSGDEFEFRKYRTLRKR